MIKEEASGAPIYKACPEFVLSLKVLHQRQKASSKLAMLSKAPAASNRGCQHKPRWNTQVVPANQATKLLRRPARSHAFPVKDLLTPRRE
jgi:hypothetical protein